MLNLFTFLVFLVVFLGTLAIASVTGRQRREAREAERLDALLEQVNTEANKLSREQVHEESVLLTVDKYDGPFPALHERWQALLKGLEALGWMPTIRLRLIVLAAVSFGLAALVARMTPSPWLVTFTGGIVIGVLLGAVLYWRAMAQWIEALGMSLPEAIDAIARICRAGVPAQTAFGLTAQNLHGPLAQEFRRLDQWLRLGVPLKEVLQESARRVNLPEYRFFAVILIISQESGGRLADTLERLAATLRDRAELRLKVEAKTSEARASIKIVAALVPGVLIYQYIQSPGDFLFLVSDPVGIKVLIYAACSVGLGLFITWVMVKRIR